MWTGLDENGFKDFTGWFIIETNSTCRNFLKLNFMNYTLFKKKFLKVVILYFKPAVAHGIRD